MTIHDFVQQCFAAGMSPNQAWDAAVSRAGAGGWPGIGVMREIEAACGVDETWLGEGLENAYTKLQDEANAQTNLAVESPVKRPPESEDEQIE